MKKIHKKEKHNVLTEWMLRTGKRGLTRIWLWLPWMLFVASYCSLAQVHQLCLSCAYSFIQLKSWKHVGRIMQCFCASYICIPIEKTCTCHVGLLDCFSDWMRECLDKYTFKATIKINLLKLTYDVTKYIIKTHPEASPIAPKLVGP